MRCLNLALGAEAGQRTMHLHPMSALNSFHCAPTDGGREERVEVETLDRILDREVPGRVALLKIDAEGHDLEVLKGATGALASGRFDLIQVEAGFDAPGPPQPPLHEVQDFLRRFDYHLNSVTNQCRAMLGKLRGGTGGGAPVLVYCDAIFVNGRDQHVGTS